MYVLEISGCLAHTQAIEATARKSSEPSLLEVQTQTATKDGLMKGTNVKQGLILVDIQNDYFPDGNFELVGVKQASRNAQKLLQKFRDKQSPIVHVQHSSKQPGATFFARYTRI
ncbi:isochorismatase family protein [Stenomitos frigidus AS-A4]|uniref:Isochorismatase family protein n=1 Tax=Stenomitos frigidus AS-A4 TaxID=2933935 RepID=A0ABV0KTL1_9CYAN|nr:isochorismatase family protein [Phormidium sp. FACHB-592]